VETIGVALMVGGAAFVFSGLFFFIRSSGDRTAPQAFEDMQQRVEQHLVEMRRIRTRTGLSPFWRRKSASYFKTETPCAGLRSIFVSSVRKVDEECAGV
jgi:hypothetical protein